VVRHQLGRVEGEGRAAVELGRTDAHVLDVSAASGERTDRERERKDTIGAEGT
jgi:hypothetical protein